MSSLSRYGGDGATARWHAHGRLLCMTRGGADVMVRATKSSAAPHRLRRHGFPPLPPGYLGRPRLLAQLDRATRLTIVRGPAGSGKSALLGEWVRLSEHCADILWISLDSRSGTRARFWERVASSARAAFGHEAGALGHPEAVSSPGTLLDALARLPTDLLVVLDDLHHVDDAVVDDLLWVLERSARLRVAVTTQRVHTLENHEAVARLSPAVISADDLAFTVEEALALAVDAARLDTTAAKAIRDRTGGHALATRIAIAPPRHRSEQQRAGEEASDIAGIIASGRHDLLWARFVANSVIDQTFARSAALEAALLRLPVTTLRAHGEIAIILASLRSTREPSPSARTLMLVERAFETLLPRCDSEAPGDRLLTLAAVLAGNRAARRAAESVATADAIMSTIGQLDPLDRARTAHTTEAISVHVMSTYVTHGRFDDALSIAAQSDGTEHVVHARRVHQLARLAGALSGDLRRHPVGLDIDHSGDLDGSEPGRSPEERIARAIHLIEDGSTDAAFAVLDEVDASVPQRDCWPFAVWARGLARLVSGDAELGASEVLSRAREFRRPSASPAGLDLVYAMGSDLLLAAGQRDRASRLVADRPRTSPVIALALSRQAVAADRLGDGRELVGSIVWSESSTPRVRAEALLMRAAIDTRLSLPGEARESARLAFAIMAPRGLRTPLAMVPRRDLAEALPDDEPTAELRRASPDPFGSALARNTLTARELEVLTRLVTTPGVDAIAASLYVSSNTVKTQLRSIYRKLGVSSREDAIRTARGRGLLPD